MFENKSHHRIKYSNEKNFGLVFAGFFFIISIYPIIYGNKIAIWSLITSFLFLFFSLVYAKILKLPNYLWNKFGILLGYIISPLIMFLIYFVVFLPIGFLYQIFKIKNQKKLKNSFWINRKDDMESLKKQF